MPWRLTCWCSLLLPRARLVPLARCAFGLAHEHTRIANLVYWKDKPVAASVLTYGPFVIAASLTIASRLLVGLYIHKGIAFRLPSWVS